MKDNKWENISEKGKKKRNSSTHGPHHHCVGLPLTLSPGGRLQGGPCLAARLPSATLTTAQPLLPLRATVDPALLPLIPSPPPPQIRSHAAQAQAREAQEEHRTSRRLWLGRLCYHWGKSPATVGRSRFLPIPSASLARMTSLLDLLELLLYWNPIQEFIKVFS
jgi:hypothetical protein